MMNYKWLLVSVLVVFAFAMSVWSLMRAPKIAFVRTEELVNKYEGMAEASKEYQKKNASWQASVDSMKKILQGQINTYISDSLKLSKIEKEVRLRVIAKLQNDLVEYSKVISEKANVEDQNMTQQVLNQVNSFIQDYGKSHGYTMILGTTSSGNIMYGNEACDITELVVKELNEHYRK